MAKKITEKQNLLSVHRDKLRLSDHSTVKINGIETTVSEYYQNPEKYNTIKLNPKYIKECEEHLRKSIKTKATLQIDPYTLKSIL